MGDSFSGGRTVNFGFEMVGDDIAKKLAVTPGHFYETYAHSTRSGVALRMVRIGPSHLCWQFQGAFIRCHDKKFEFFLMM